MFSPKRLLRSTPISSEVSSLQASVDYISFFEDYIIVFGWINDEHEVWDIIEIQQEEKSISIDNEKVTRLTRFDVNHHVKADKSSKLGFFFIIPNSIQDSGKIIEGEVKFKVLSKSKSKFSSRANLVSFNQVEFKGAITSLPDIEIDKIQDNCKLALGVSFEKENIALVEVHFDYFLAYGNIALAGGWLFDPSNAVQAIEIFSDGNLITKDMRENLFSIARPDVQKFFQESTTTINLYSGFITLIKSQPELEFSNHIEVRLIGKRGELLQSLGVKVEKQMLYNFRKATSRIFASLPIGNPNLFEIYRDVIAPFFEKVAPIWMPNQKQSLVTNFGEAPKNPKVSIIIPLYGRFDYITFQLAQFSNDENLKNTAQLIYVVDDPNIYEGVQSHVKSIHPVFNVPLKIVYPGENLGFARANNYGAQFAEAEYILCMNSDVFPKTENWLAKMLEGLKAKEDCGIYSPRLLYEDGSIQYAGMRFEKSPFLQGFWFNIHPGKGQPPEIFDDNQIKEIPAATGACMLMKKEVFDGVGGFDEGYLQGDFEDSDLNLKLYEKGYKNYYDPNIELYHLERKSQGLFASEEWKLKLTLYNALNHTLKWDTLINTINQRQLL